MWGSWPSVEMQLVCSTTPAEWAVYFFFFLLAAWYILYINLFSLRVTKFNLGGLGAVILIRRKIPRLNSQSNNRNLFMRHLILFTFAKNVLSGLNEDVGRRSTSDKTWFDSCERSFVLAFSILENNNSQQNVVPNMFTTCWFKW